MTDSSNFCDSQLIMRANRESKNQTSAVDTQENDLVLRIIPAEIKPKRDWKSIIISGGLLAALVSTFIFTHNTWYNVPVLTYEILPAYPASADEQIVAIIVRNEGRASATDVRVIIQGAGAISVPPTLMQEETRISLQGGSSIVADLPGFPPATQVSLFLRAQTSASSPISDVYISSLQGLGSRRSQGASQSLILS